MLLLAVNASPGYSQNSSPALEEFRGLFSPETYGSGKTNAGSRISSSFVFQESGDGSKYAVYIPFYFLFPPRHEYAVQGVSLQKFLPEKAKDADYRRIVQSAWPDFTSAETKQVAKTVKDWVKKNPNMPLLLVNSLQRVNTPVKIGSPVGVLKQVNHVFPNYPRDALTQRLQGNVTFEIVIDESGNVEQMEIVQGPPLFTDAAADAVRQWKYSPLVIGGNAVAVTTKVIVHFRISQTGSRKF